MSVPQGSVLQREIVFEQQPSRTYKLDLQRKRMVGKTDGLDAVKQSVYKILKTERFAHLIYDASYGFEGHGLIGHDPLFVQSELRRRISEALLQDDRVTDITDFQISLEGDSALVRFTVVSDYGTFDMEVSQVV